jgi:hypothetical protein
MDPRNHMNWAGNAMNLALIGSASMIAASMSIPGRRGDLR